MIIRYRKHNNEYFIPFQILIFLWILHTGPFFKELEATQTFLLAKLETHFLLIDWLIYRLMMEIKWMNAALCRAPQQADNKASHSGVCLFQLCAVLCSRCPLLFTARAFLTVHLFVRKRRDFKHNSGCLDSHLRVLNVPEVQQKRKKRVLLSWHNFTGRLSGFFVLESYCDFLLHNVLAIPLLWLMPRCWPEAVASAHSLMIDHTLQQEGQAATSRTLAFYRSPPACPGAPQWNSPRLTGSLCFFSPHAKLLKEFFWTKCGRRKLGLNVKYRVSRQTLLVELANPIISPRCSPQCSTIWPTAENY